MHREASFALLHTLPPRFMYTRWPHTPPGTETHANKTGPPGSFIHTPTSKTHTDIHKYIRTSGKIFSLHLYSQPMHANWIFRMF